MTCTRFGCVQYTRVTSNTYSVDKKIYPYISIAFNFFFRHSVSVLLVLILFGLLV